MDLKIGEGPNVPAGLLIDLIDATKARIARKDGPMKTEAVTLETKISDIDFPKDLNSGPNGILVACLAHNLKTVADLAKLDEEKNNIKRHKLNRQIGDDRWAAIGQVVRIAQNNAKRPLAEIPPAATLHKPARCQDGLSTPPEDPNDEVRLYLDAAPVMPDSVNITKKTRARLDFALEMARDGYDREDILDRVRVTKSGWYNWTSKHPDFARLLDLAIKAGKRYGGRPGYNGAEDFAKNVAGEGDVTIPFDPEKHHMPAGRIVTKKAPDLTNDPDIPVQDRRHHFPVRPGAFEEPTVDDTLGGEIEALINECDPESPIIAFVTPDGEVDVKDIHPRMGREIYRLWDSGVWGKDHAEVIANLVSYAIRKLA